MVRVIPKLCDMDISISIFPISRVFVSTATDLGSQTMIALITILKSILLNTIFFCGIKSVIQLDKAFTPSSYLYFLVRNQWAFRTWWHWRVPYKPLEGERFNFLAAINKRYKQCERIGYWIIISTQRQLAFS